MSFTGIDADSIVGTTDTGVQARFPRFTFDDRSLPSLDQVTQYAETAIRAVARAVQFKGYTPEAVGNTGLNANAADDIQFLTDWIELKVAVAVHAVLDQFKDTKVTNVIQEELKNFELRWNTTNDPFPALVRTRLAEAQNSFPIRLVRR